MMRGSARLYGTSLLAGALLIGVAGLFHPILSGDGAAQLATIAKTDAWRTIHWALLFGLPLLLTGLLGVVYRHIDTPGASFARAGAVVAAFACAIWALNILFMVGAARQLALAYRTAEPGLTATRAVFLYDMLHPFGLAAERLATFSLGLVMGLFGAAVWRGKTWPRWQAGFAWLAGAIAVGIAIVSGEATPNLLYGAQGVVVAWCAVAGVRLLV